ncbi:MAG: linear amide C-N hydrolase [Candidatus Eisenbacteria bacterium]|nr:linear amide C-N hydrolase [Candidatus Eisenbacteria bacterium]
MRLLTAAVLCCLLLICPRGSPASACTSFVMDTPDGPFFGTNLDLFIPGDGLVLVNRRGVEKQSHQTSATGEQLQWISEYGSVTFNLAGLEFAWGGMNEAGLALSSMELRAGEYPKPDGRPALYKGNWGQYVLDTCSSVDEVIATDTLARVQDQGHTDQYLVADAEGNAVAIEYLNGRFVYYKGDDLPVRAMANMRYDRALYAYEHGGTRWWWSNPGQSAERVAACQTRAERFDATRDTSAVDYAFGTLLYYVAAPHTRWSIVFDMADRELWFRSDQSPTYEHVSFNEFDFSCDAPKLKLDVNVQLDGDVEQHFVPYDSEVNLSVFRTFCERYGVKVSEEEAADLTGFFEGFECARP